MRNLIAWLILWAVEWLDRGRESNRDQAPRYLVATRRSSKWPAVRTAWLLVNPRCALCGGTEDVEVHHVVPFHVDPSRELDPSNLLTLCEESRRLNGLNCHLFAGHLGNWQQYNPRARAMCIQLQKFFGEDQSNPPSSPAPPVKK